jgi:formate dehydrogenase subunit beta
MEAREGVEQAVQDVLRRLLERGVVDSLLVPVEVPGGSVAPTLVREAGLLEHAAPLAPVLPINAARAVQALTVTGHRERLGAVLRSCEIRALVELVKFQQAKLDNVLIVGIDCLGTYGVQAWQQAGDKPRLVAEMLAGAQSGDLKPAGTMELRSACQICEQPAPAGEHVALTIGLLGVEPGRLHLQAREDIAHALELTGNGQTPGRKQALDTLIATRTAARNRAFAAYHDRVKTIDGLLSEFGRCIRCHNCMINCPICYCRECIFRTPTFEHDSELFYQWAERKGSVRMLPDTLLFHLTRLNHMVTSCVGCGMCTEACPAGIDVGVVFRAVGEKVQALFDYHPGQSLDEAAPVQEFREDELKELGERPH